MANDYIHSLQRSSSSIASRYFREPVVDLIVLENDNDDTDNNNNTSISHETEVLSCYTTSS